MTDGIQTYLQKISGHKLLTSEQEVELANTIHAKTEGKDRERAIETLCIHNLKLVAKEAFRIGSATGAEFDELVGAGNLGLVKAAVKFEVEFKTKFSTYAIYWIREAMQDYVYRNLSPVTIPVHISNGVARMKHMYEHGKQPSEADIMKELKVSPSTLEYIKKAYIQAYPLDKALKDGDNNAADLGDVMEDPTCSSPSEETAKHDDYAHLHDALKQLDPMSREIVMAQYLSADKVQLRKLGKKFSMTGERVRQIREKALNTLRKKMKARG